MTVEHLLYIPGILILGLSIGYALGARAVRAEVEKMRRRAKQ